MDHPTHGAGAWPSQALAPTATRLATPNADQCVHQPREGRGRNRQTTPKKRKRGGRTNKQHRQKKGGGQETDTQPRSRAPTPQEAGEPPSQATRKATPTGPPERTPEDRPAEPGDTQPRAAAHRRTGQPGHAGTHPTGEVAGRKKNMGRAQTKGEGGMETKRPKTGTGSGGHHKATTRQGQKPQPPPPQPEKKRGGGQTPPMATPAHLHATGSPTRGWRKTDAAQASGHTTQHPSQKKAECRQNPDPHTHTTNPSQESQSATKTSVQTNTP